MFFFILCEVFFCFVFSLPAECNSLLNSVFLMIVLFCVFCVPNPINFIPLRILHNECVRLFVSVCLHSKMTHNVPKSNSSEIMCTINNHYNQKKVFIAVNCSNTVIWDLFIYLFIHLHYFIFINTKSFP